MLPPVLLVLALAAALAGTQRLRWGLATTRNNTQFSGLRGGVGLKRSRYQIPAAAVQFSRPPQLMRGLSESAPGSDPCSVALANNAWAKLVCDGRTPGISRGGDQPS